MKQGEIVPDEGFVIMIQVCVDASMGFLVQHVINLFIPFNIILSYSWNLD